MKRFSLLLIALMMAAAAAYAQPYAQPVANGANGSIVTCESLNNIRHTCRVDTMSGVTLSRRLSDNACVRGQSWGVNRRGIWVDKGCRAEFLIGNTNGTYSANGTYTGGGRSIICESGGSKHRCSADTAYGVQMSRQISNHSCKRGSDWGFDQNGIWVDNGCRAEFLIGTTSNRYPTMSSSSSYPSNYRSTVVCESSENKTTRCAANTDYGISLTHQLSKASCVRDRTWGYDRSGVWVSNGCRAEFTLGQ